MINNNVAAVAIVIDHLELRLQWGAQVPTIFLVVRVDQLR